ncbi:MAG: PAS domain-containing sensor histidine kinase [Thermodesulfobacteriota bacterium]
MNLFDMRTILFGHLITSIVCAVIVVQLWRQNRTRFAGLTFWMIDFIFQVVAVLLVIMRGVIPDWTSMVFSNTLVISGAILGLMGMERFLEKQGTQIHNCFLVIIFIFVHSYFTFVQPNLSVRDLNLSTALLLICLQYVWLIWHRVEPGLRSLAFGVGAVNFLYCLVSSIRIVNFFITPHEDRSYFQPGIFDILILLSYQVLFILLTYSFVLMVNKRLLADISFQEEKFSKLFQSSPYAIILTRMSDGCIINVNQGFVALTGYQREEAVGRKSLDFPFWQNKEDRDAAIAVLLKNGRVRGMEYQFHTKNGERVVVLLFMEIILINGQQHVFTSFNDISQRKLAEEQLHELNENLQKRVELETKRRMVQERLLTEHSRQAAMGNMIGAIAHQWRQPLSTLGMMIQRISAAGSMQELTGQQMDDFKINAMRQIEYMSDTIDEFRNFYQTEKTRSPFQPRVCFEDAIRLLENQLASRNITVTMTCPKEADIFLNAYQNEFKQVVLNLLINARDAILDRRTFSGAPEAGLIEVSCFLSPENTWVMDIHDNGTGIPDQIVELIFNPYFTTRQDKGGSGIGLYISRLIIEESFKGRISLTHRKEGATFRIELPLEEES